MAVFASLLPLRLVSLRFSKQFFLLKHLLSLILCSFGNSITESWHAKIESQDSFLIPVAAYDLISHANMQTANVLTAHGQEQCCSTSSSKCNGVL